jgi:branched-chain amino acid transport system substrate-binding protein
MKHLHAFVKTAVLLTACTLFNAQAQIKIGQTAGLTGPVASSVKELNEGATLYFDAINQRGGINGQKIELISLDDKFDPKQAAENARILIEERGVMALFLNRGTPHTEAIMPLLAQHQLALVAPSTGAMLLHQPVNPYIFNVRATYQREAEKAILHQASIGISRMTVIHVDDSFGADSLAGALNGFKQANLQPVGTYSFNRGKPDFSAMVPKIVESNAQSVMIIGSASAVTEGIKALRASGSRAQIMTLSNNASTGFIKGLGDLARGVIVTQVFPYEKSIAFPIVKEAQELAKSKGIAAISPSHLEGYSAAKVMVAALQRAGNKPTRASVIAALNNLRKLDIGGLEVNFSPTDHSGLTFADLSIIGSDGQFRR